MEHVKLPIIHDGKRKGIDEEIVIFPLIHGQYFKPNLKAVEWANIETNQEDFINSAAICLLIITR